MIEDKIFDFAGVMDRLDNDRDLLKEIVQIFFEGLEESLGAIKRAADKKDGPAYGAAAHSIKGALGNIGAMRAYRKAYELETKGKNSVMDNALGLLDELQKEISAFKSEYEKSQI